MTLILIYGAALLMALLFASPALDWFQFKPFGDFAPLRFRLGDFLRSELGAVTVTYYIRGGPVTINGSTTGPTAAQAQQVMRQSAKIVFGVTADVQALFTHNWGLDASAPGYNEPEIEVELLSVTTYWPFLTFDRANPNVLTVNKPNSDAPTTIIVSIRRPHSVGQ